MEHVTLNSERVHCSLNTLIQRIHHKISSSSNKRERKREGEAGREREGNVMANEWG